MNASQLRNAIETAGHKSHFFDRKTMQFFGDSMSNFGVRAVTVLAMGDTVNPDSGKYEMRSVDAWEIYRHHPVKHGLKGSHFFDRNTFKKLHCVDSVQPAKE